LSPTRRIREIRRKRKIEVEWRKNFEGLFK